MAFYQNHVVQLCAAAGIRVSACGCPELGPGQSALTSTLSASAATVRLGRKPSPRHHFDNVLYRAMTNTALTALLGPKSDPMAPKGKLAKQHSRMDTLDVPLDVRVTQQDGLRGINAAIGKALTLKPADILRKCLNISLKRCCACTALQLRTAHLYVAG